MSTSLALAPLETPPDPSWSRLREANRLDRAAPPARRAGRLGPIGAAAIVRPFGGPCSAKAREHLPEIQLHLERPRASAPSSLRARGDGYSCSYALSGPPGATLLQVVRVEVAYTRDERTLVSYSGSYLEYFLLDAEGRTQLDTHDLSLRRDGWVVASSMFHREAWGNPASTDDADWVWFS